jgi:hypothetical protein
LSCDAEGVIIRADLIGVDQWGGRMRHLLRTVAVAAALVMAIPAAAITFGQPDGNRHPYVGALVVKLGDGTLIPWCSGTMVSDQVFLTAAHCTYFAELFFGEQGYDLGVTFVPDLGLDDVEPAFDESDLTFGEGHTYPSFDGKLAANAKRVDVAVVVLDDDPGVGHAQLPSENLLETLDLATTRFTAVGYGISRDDKTKGPQTIVNDGLRRFSEQSGSHFNRSWFLLSMNPSTGNGGTCNGDSGGPHFVGTGPTATTIVSVTSWGDRYCRSTDWTARVDTEEALGFVTSFIE